MRASKKLPATVVAVAGSAGLDLTLRDPPRRWIGEVPRDVYTHRTLLPLRSPAEMGLGGNGGSASYVLGKLGCRVHLNAPIGEDPAGQLVRGWLAGAGVQCIAPAGRSTMQAITAVDATGRRLGTLQHVGPALDWSLSARDEEATWLLASLPGQIPVEVMPEVLHLLRAFGGAGAGPGAGYGPRLDGQGSAPAGQGAVGPGRGGGGHPGRADPLDLRPHRPGGGRQSAGSRPPHRGPQDGPRRSGLPGPQRRTIPTSPRSGWPRAMSVSVPGTPSTGP